MLEPFVANFQISMTPELKSLREKTAEEARAPIEWNIRHTLNLL